MINYIYDISISSIYQKDILPLFQIKCYFNNFTPIKEKIVKCSIILLFDY